ncbi:Delta and Notch-like epidermal growth factor-related receptor [Cricetulus griseus]|uniref:Delta and Notch-like epidermal growth factor-related receptor n=1 Tax=Cricetulus griseus TaxID=10029 RepID=G3IFZ3_CRIGR|nr:Delta and Notch-like epidermal growth factor-related receptor [Cricetulus griseus]
MRFRKSDFVLICFFVFRIRQDATASLILLWKVTATGFQQCSLIDGRSVTPLQAPGGLVLLEEMLALGPNHFIGFVNDSVAKSIVALRLTLVVKASNCVPGDNRLNDIECSGKGKCVTKPSEATFSCTCEDQYIGTFCEEFDACQRKPCQNEASCIDANEKQDGSNFTCLCLPGYTGELCQSKIDYCVLDPCRNGATCVSSLSGFTCQCLEGMIIPVVQSIPNRMQSLRSCCLSQEAYSSQRLKCKRVLFPESILLSNEPETSVLLNIKVYEH